jgi:hypothetical protein
MAAIGAILALGGLGYYTTQGVKKVGKQAQDADSGTWRNRYQDNSLSLRDPGQISYAQNQPISHVSTGYYGLPRTYYQQAGTDALVRAYGRPDKNIMKLGNNSNVQTAPQN